MNVNNRAASLPQMFHEATDEEFASWLIDVSRPLLDAGHVQAIRVYAESANSLGESQRILNRLESVPEVRDAPLLMAFVWRGLANVYQAYEQYENALAAAQQAVEIYKMHSAEFEMAKAQVIQVVVLGLTGRYHDALALAQDIQPQFERENFQFGLGHLALARAVAHTTALQHQEAMANYCQALQYFSKYPSETALTRLNMGVLGNQMDLLDEARQWLKAALVTFKKKHNTINLIKTYSALAYNCVRRGEYKLALEQLNQARSTLVEEPESLDNGFVDLDMAVVRQRLNQLEEAERLAQQAIDRFKQANRPLETAEALLFLARILAQCGTVEHLSRASSALDEAEQLMQEADMPIFIAWVRLDQSELFLRRNRAEDAKRKAEAAQQIFRKEDLVLWQAQAQIILGDAHWRWAPSDAESYYRSALTLNGNRDSLLTARAWRGLGRLASLAGNWQEAETCLTKALKALESLRCGLSSHIQQAGFLEDKRPLATELLAAIGARVANDPQAARRLLSWLERWKGVALADLIAGQPADSTLNAEMQVLWAERERMIRRRDELQQTKGAADGAPKLSIRRSHTLAAEDADRIRELTEVRRRLETIDEVLAQGQMPSINWRQGVTIESRKVHKLLDKKTLLVSYYTASPVTTFQEQGLEQLYAMTATNQPGDLQIHDLNVTLSEVAALWEQHFQYMEAKARLNQWSEREYKSLQKRLGELYRILIQPFASRLDGKERLILLPERELSQIPFAALYERETERYLVEQVVLQTAPSATVLDRCRRRPTGKLPPLLVGWPGKRGSEEYLGNVRTEIKTIDEVLSETTVLLGEKATIANFWKESKGRSLIHLAGHGHFDLKHPLEAGITLVNNKRVQASDLYLHYGLLEGATVVLSACSTGQMKSWGGDTLGLISGFIYAGASGVISSLWPVEDMATAHFMEVFYGQIKKGNDTATSLKNAQLALLKSEEHSAPYYWAAFLLSGDSRVL